MEVSSFPVPFRRDPRCPCARDPGSSGSPTSPIAPIRKNQTVQWAACPCSRKEDHLNLAPERRGKRKKNATRIQGDNNFGPLSPRSPLDPASFTLCGGTSLRSPYFSPQPTPASPLSSSRRMSRNPSKPHRSPARMRRNEGTPR